MVNKPKAIGTAAESAVLKVVKPYFPRADRAALHGSQDIGDLINTGEFCFEVKGGNAARIANEESTGRQISLWHAEAVVEAAYAGAQYPILVVQRRGVSGANAHRWWAYLMISHLSDLLGHSGYTNRALVKLELGDLMQIIGDNGHDESDAAA